VKTNVVFLPRDPDWAYVFWQISESDREKAQSLGANKLCLRLFDASGSEGSNLNQGTLREIAVDSYSTEWYLPIPLADRDYKVELGYKYGFNWMSLAFSSISHVPGSHPSEQILDKFVPFNLDSTSESIPDISTPDVSEQNGMHERLYQAATNISLRRKVGSEELMENIPLSKNIAGIVTNQNVNDVYGLYNKNNKKISTICSLENMDDHQISNGDLITLQLNEGVIYMGQIEDDDALDKYK